VSEPRVLVSGERVLEVRDRAAACHDCVIGTLFLRSCDRHVTAFSVGSKVGGGSGCPTKSSSLREPRARFLIAKDDDVLAALEDELEVAAAQRLLRPPAVDDAPLLPHERDAAPVDPLRRALH